MIWLESTVQDFDLFDVEKVFDRYVKVTVNDEVQTQEQLGQLVSVERVSSEKRMILVFVFKHAGYVLAEGPLSHITIETTPDADKIRAEIGRVLEEYETAREKEKQGWLARMWTAWGQ